MEEKIISLTYKNSYEDIYKANYTYASVKGKLSGRHFLKVLTPAFLLCGGAMVLTFFEEGLNFEEDKLFFVVAFLLIIAALLICYFAGKAFNKLQIKNLSSLLCEGFNTKNPRRADFYADKVTVESGYSRLSIPYEEFDYVISDRYNFVFGFGGDLNVRNIPKTNQNPDVLFVLDGLFTEKLGEKFINKM